MKLSRRAMLLGTAAGFASPAWAQTPSSIELPGIRTLLASLHPRGSLSPSWTQLQASSGLLEDVLEALFRVDPARLNQCSRAEQIAFWLNAHNVCVLGEILAHWPVESVGQIPGIWSDPRQRLAGRLVSLEWVAHNRLRSRLDEPRCLFALAPCTVRGPRPSPLPYTAGSLELELGSAMAGFFADPQKNRIDREQRTVWLNPILRTYGLDLGPLATDLPGTFPDKEARVRWSLRLWAHGSPDDDIRRFLLADEYSVSFLDPDDRLA